MARRKQKAEGQPPLTSAQAPSSSPTPTPVGPPAPTTTPTTSPTTAPDCADQPRTARQAVARVLCFEQCPQSLGALRQALERLGLAFESASTLCEAREAVATGCFDAAVVGEGSSESTGAALAMVRDFASDEECACRFIVTSASGDLCAAVDAMRSGATDFVPAPFTSDAMAQRLAAALEQARRIRDNKRKVERLRRICKRLNTAREQVSGHVDTLCNDLVTAYEDMAEQMTTATLATEFNALVRQELDVESLLRTTLEYLLTKTGPTNAAVFLPTGQHDYNLGAYVNYDIQRETADVLLDHLADIIPQRFDTMTDLLRLDTEAALRRRLGDEANWLTDSVVVVFACLDGDECLAVVALFRDRRTPFTDDILAQVRVMRDVFTQQLARVVRIHHRAVGAPEWPGFDIEDDRGMAA